MLVKKPKTIPEGCWRHNYREVSRVHDTQVYIGVIQKCILSDLSNKLEAYAADISTRMSDNDVKFH